MELKFFALFSLIPCCYVVAKFMKRMDITSIDIVILMNALYLGVIPLLGNQQEILYSTVRNNSNIQFKISLVSFLFLSCLVLIDFFVKKNIGSKTCLYNITCFFREWINRYQLTTRIYLLMIVILGILFVIAHFSFDFATLTGKGSMDDIRLATKNANTPFSLWLMFGSHVLRLLMVVLLVSTYLRRIKIYALKGEKIIFFILVGLFFIFHFLVSRTYFIESILMCFLLLYSYCKNFLRWKHFLLLMTTLFLTLVIFFPLVSGVRMMKKSMIVEGKKDVAIIDIATLPMKYLFDQGGSASKIDNSSSRSWYIYQIIGLALDRNYWGNGELTANAISFGIPKALYAEKSAQGSQGIIEFVTGANKDVADSILLLGVLENRYIGFILASVYFLISIMIYDFLFKILSSLKIKSFLCAPIVASGLFLFLSRVEYSLDNFIPFVIRLIMWYFAIVLMMKFLNENKMNEDNVRGVL